MSLVRTLVRNIASNWAGYGVQVVVAFFLTPYIVHSLGQTQYGIWTLVIGLTGYYGLLDLGVACGLTQYLTRDLVTGDTDSLNKTASTGFVALACCGFLVFVISVALALNASDLFHIPPDSSKEAALVIVITGVSVAVQFVFMTYSAVFTAVQRFDLSNAIGIATRLVLAVATVLSLKLGYGLVALSLVTAGANMIDYFLRWRVSAQLLPSMKVSFKFATRQKLREVVKFGVWNMAIAGSVRLISYTDAVVIAAFMPVSAVAPFAIAASLRTYFEDIFTRVGYVFFPAATELDAQGDRDGLRRLYLIGSKFMFLGSILCGSIAICWARDFFQLWIGAVYAEPSAYPSVAILFCLLALGSMVSVAQRIGYQVLLGMRQVGLLAGLFALEGVSNLLVSVVLVRNYGLLGVALGTLLPAVVAQGVFQAFFVCRALQIPLNTYCRQVLLRPILVSLALLPLLLSSLFVDPVRDWATLFLWAAATFALAAPMVLLVGLTKTERDLVLVRAITIAFDKISAAVHSRRHAPPEPIKNKSF